jgi:methyl-accepting chemotaxis protein
MQHKAAIFCVLISLMISALVAVDLALLPGAEELQGGAGALTTLQAFGLGWVKYLAAIAALIPAIVLMRTVATFRNYLNEIRTAAGFGARHSAADGDDDFVIFRASINSLVGQRDELLGREIEMKQQLEREAQSAKNACDDAITARERAEASRRDGLLSASKTLGAAIGGIHDSCEALRNMSEATGKGAQDQQELIREAVGVMDRLDEAVAQMMRRSDRAVGQAETAQQKASQGSVVVEQTVSAIRSVEQKAEDLAGVVRELGAQAQAVEKIMEVIRDIADQTNLLALNAAIEAARAGDAGRGFAVVADEVRKLAEKTMNATSEVAQRIGGIQQGVQRTEADMAETAGRVDEAVKLAQGSGESLREIVALAGGTASNIRDIAEAAREHAETSGSIGSLVRQVSGISEESYRGAQGAVESVAALVKRVEGLEAMNAVFQLIGGGSVQGMVEELAANAKIRSMRREEQEQAMREALRRNQSFELVYITDATGRQVVSNIGRDKGAIVEDKASVGRDWSGRPWFKEPAETRSIAVSEVYVSSATGENCITVSTPLVDGSGALLGVLAADVNLGQATNGRGH